MTKKHSRMVVIALILWVANVSSITLEAQEAGDAVVLHEGIVYRPGEIDLKLDLYLPGGEDEAVPCVLVVQGGGFRSATDRRFGNYGRRLAERGMAAAVIDYRGLPDHTYPTTLSDVEAAAGFLREHGRTYHIDPDRIAAMGQSAGATIVTLLALRDESHADLAAVVGIAGVYDFVARFADPRQLAMQSGVAGKQRSNAAWIGEDFSEHAERWRDASAQTHANAGDPPVLLLHCRDDAVVPWLQAQSLHDTLVEAGVSSRLEIYETGGHQCLGRDGWTTLDRAIAFLNQALAQNISARNSPTDNDD